MTCQLNELCSICIVSSLEVTKESMDLYTVQRGVLDHKTTAAAHVLFVLVLHVFEEDTVANVAVSHGKSFLWIFWLGPAPFLICFANLLEDLRVVWLRWFLFVLSLSICHFHGPVPVQNSFSLDVRRLGFCEPP